MTSLPHTHPPPVNLTCPASISGGKSLREILQSTTSEAQTRIQDAELLYEKIAKTLGEAKANSNFPKHLVDSFKDFIADLNTVARSHFESHVKGTPRPPPCAKMKEKRVGSNRTASIKNSLTVIPLQIKSTYAVVTEAPVPQPQYPMPQKPTNRTFPTRPSPNKDEDNRLFIRIS